MTAPTGRPVGRPRIHPLRDPSLPPPKRGRPTKAKICQVSAQPSTIPPIPTQSPQDPPNPQSDTIPQPETIATQNAKIWDSDASTEKQLIATETAKRGDTITPTAQESLATGQPRAPEITENPENDVNQENQQKEPDGAEMLETALTSRVNNLKKLVKVLLPLTDAHTRARVVSSIELLADGVHFMDVLGSTGLKLAQINAWNRRAGFIKLWYAAKEAGELVRQAKREQIAHKHAVEGTEKPVFQQGVQVGLIREFDHRLLEFLLKADNPSKYRDGASVQVNNQVTSVIVEKHRE